MVALGDLASWLGRMRWVEQRCFELLGGWVTSEEDPALKVAFAEDCYHHAWHAEVWADRFPHGYGHELASATSPGGQGWGEVFDRLADAPGSIERVSGFYRVLLPRKIAVYDHFADVLDPHADRPVVRWLDRVVADEVTDWRRGQAVAQRLRAEGDGSAIVAWESSLEEAVLRAGVLAGPPNRLGYSGNDP